MTAAGVVRAAGGVVHRPAAGGGVEVLVAHRARYDDWSLPKGKADPGEADEACAVREVEEEVGLRCTPGRELPVREYVDHRGRPKRVRYWAMAAPAGAEARGDGVEVDDVRWVAPAVAAGLLSYVGDRQVVAAFATGLSGR